MVEGAGPIGLSTSTDPLSTPLTLSQAKHLHARLTFGAGPDQVNASEGRLALDVVNELLDAAELDLETAPEWADVLLPPRNASDEDQQQFSDDNAAWRQVLRDDLVREMTVNGLRGKLFLFWHNHFVTSMETYRYAALGYRYVFRTFDAPGGRFNAYACPPSIEKIQVLRRKTRSSFATRTNLPRGQTGCGVAMPLPQAKAYQRIQMVQSVS